MLCCFAWIFFRAESAWQAFDYIAHIGSNFHETPEMNKIKATYILFPFIVMEWLQRNKKYPLDISKLNVTYRWGIYYTLVVIILFKYSAGQNFIYFQF